MNNISRVIVGLGNPENEYKGTRHNVGFEVINKLGHDYRIPVKKNKYRAHIGEGEIARRRVLLVKPQTYMNASGESVVAVLRFYKIPPSELIVVYDDVSLPVGDIRVREKGSAGGQKGMKSIIECLGTDDFPRVRIGIGQKPPDWDLADYVLSRFAKNELAVINESIGKAGDAVVLMLSEGIASAMNQYNTRIKKADVDEGGDI